MTTETETIIDASTTSTPAAAESTILTTQPPAVAAAETTTAPETPVEYSYTLPEGIDLDEKGAAALTDFAKAKNLSPAAAQELANLYAERVQAQAQAFQETVKGWETEVKKDPDLGGDKLASTIGDSKLAIEKYGSPALLALLDSSRMGSHPEVLRFLKKVGSTLKEDTVVVGKPSTAPAKSFYDNSNMAP